MLLKETRNKHFLLVKNCFVFVSFFNHNEKNVHWFAWNERRTDLHLPGQWAWVVGGPSGSWAQWVRRLSTRGVFTSVPCNNCNNLRAHRRLRAAVKSRVFTRLFYATPPPTSPVQTRWIGPKFLAFSRDFTALGYSPRASSTGRPPVARRTSWPWESAARCSTPRD